MIPYNARSLPHQFRTRSDLAETQQARSISDKNAIKSTKPGFVLPLITVWLQGSSPAGPTNEISDS